MNPDQPPDRPPVRFEWTWVTPVIAEYLLGWNDGNRRMRPRDAQRLAQMMRDKRFLPIHQAIALQGQSIEDPVRLLDGQHRLTAIVISGEAQWLAVAFGVDPASMIVIDDATRRSPCDTLVVAGLASVDNSYAATALRLYCGADFSGTIPKPDLPGIVQAYREAIDFAALYLPRRGRLGGATVRGAIARGYCWYRQPSDLPRLELFCRIYLDGTDKDPANRSAVLLRNFMLLEVNQSGRRSANSGRHVYLKAELALAQFMDSRPAKILRLPADPEEMFPLPAPGSLPARSSLWSLRPKEGGGT